MKFLKNLLTGGKYNEEVNYIKQRAETTDIREMVSQARLREHEMETNNDVMFRQTRNSNYGDNISDIQLMSDRLFFKATCGDEEIINLLARELKVNMREIIETYNSSQYSKVYVSYWVVGDYGDRIGSLGQYRVKVELVAERHITYDSVKYIIKDIEVPILETNEDVSVAEMIENRFRLACKELKGRDVSRISKYFNTAEEVGYEAGETTIEPFNQTVYNRVMYLDNCFK